MEPFGTARTATDKAIGFDTDAALTAVSAMAFAAAGFTFAARYLSRGEESARDLQALEVRALHACGIALVPVQHVAPPFWHPSPALGEVLGREAAENAAEIGCPQGATIWVDLEGVASDCTAVDIAGFCNHWTAAVRKAAYDAGVYVGVPSGLNSSQLYRLLSVQKYWRSLSGSTPAVDVRGYQIFQSFGGTLAGIDYDKDVIKKDALGGLPVWWAPT